jgi:3-dehydroquinate synthase
MRVIEIEGASRRSSIRIGERFQNLPHYLPGGRTIVITDANVLNLYRDEFPPFPALSIGSGEAVKNLDTVRDLYEALVDLEVDRSVFILGIGGGIVCDVAGFVATTYMRGLRFGLIPTTLLAQVDASVGGKNGVNLEGYKNLVGTISQPEFVLCDLKFLETLPEAEVVNGMAEIVKHALIADTGMFAFLEENSAEAMSLVPPAIERLVGDSVAIKSDIVRRDENDTGERRKLNFGHTFGHALERVGGLSHGEAVSVGMALASAISVHRGRLSAAAHERIVGLLCRLRLPCAAVVDPGGVVDALRKDKKRNAAKIHFILLEGIGRAAVEEIDIEELEILTSAFPEILRPRFSR